MNGPDYSGKIAEFNRTNAKEMERGLTPSKRSRAIERLHELGVPESGRTAFLEFIDGDSEAAQVARQLHYAKSPLRQNVCEIAFLEYAQKVLPDLRIRSLPNKGAEAFYPLGGKIVRSKDCPTNSLLAKSFDFQISGERGSILVATKYTRDEGGSQDNQFRDLITIAEQSLGMSGPVAVLLIADGPFYERSASEGDPISRIDFLRRKTSQETQVAAGQGSDLMRMVHRFRPLLDNGKLE